MKKTPIPSLLALSILLAGCASGREDKSHRVAEECGKAMFLAYADHMVSTVSALKRLREQRTDEAMKTLELSLENAQAAIEASGRDFKTGLETNVLRAVEIANQYRIQFKTKSRQ